MKTFEMNKIYLFLVRVTTTSGGISLSLEVNLQILNDILALQILDLECVDNRPNIERVKTLTINQIPQKSHSIFATTGTEIQTWFLLQVQRN